MRLSTKARYGTRAMLELALGYGKGPISLKEVAQRQEISEKYLEHLIVSLKGFSECFCSDGSFGIRDQGSGIRAGLLLLTPDP